MKHRPNIARHKYSPLVNAITAKVPGVTANVLIQELRKESMFPKRY